MKEWLERQIELCDELGNMEKEKWAFIQCLKYLKELQKQRKDEKHNNKRITK